MKDHEEDEARLPSSSGLQLKSCLGRRLVGFERGFSEKWLTEARQEGALKDREVFSFIGWPLRMRFEAGHDLCFWYTEGRSSLQIDSNSMPRPWEIRARRTDEQDQRQEPVISADDPRYANAAMAGFLGRTVVSYAVYCERVRDQYKARPASEVGLLMRFSGGAELMILYPHHPLAERLRPGCIENVWALPYADLPADLREVLVETHQSPVLKVAAMAQSKACLEHGRA